MNLKKHRGGLRIWGAKTKKKQHTRKKRGVLNYWITRPRVLVGREDNPGAKGLTKKKTNSAPWRRHYTNGKKEYAKEGGCKLEKKEGAWGDLRRMVFSSLIRKMLGKTPEVYYPKSG